MNNPLVKLDATILELFGLTLIYFLYFFKETKCISIEERLHLLAFV